MTGGAKLKNQVFRIGASKSNAEFQKPLNKSFALLHSPTLERVKSIKVSTDPRSKKSGFHSSYYKAQYNQHLHKPEIRRKPITKEMNKNDEKKKEKKGSNSDQPLESSDPLPAPRSSPAKRTKSPGVRMVGGRIYDSANGITCHQCRQKTRDFVAACKNQRDNKPCNYKFCYKCLLNRYGEKAEEMESLGEWHCPKCRGICNCSFCMKKRGQPPTGILVHKAKGKGYLSVSEYLLVRGSEDVCASPKKCTGSSKSICGMENSVAGSSAQGNGESAQRDDGVEMKKSKKSRGSKRPVQDSVKREEEEDKNGIEVHDAEVNDDIPLPEGVDLKIVAGIDIPFEDVGHALQFLEFCNAFGEVLDLNKGKAESILQELMNGCSRRRGQYSLVIQFHSLLLSFIQNDSGEDLSSSGKSWLQAFGKCVAESNCALKELQEDWFHKDGDGYKKLSPSQKLRLLNFLCDEALETTDLRNWIDEEQVRFTEREKDAKGKYNAAKEKEKELKRKRRDEVAIAFLSKSGDPLTIAEHAKLVSTIKAEAEKAHAETLEAEGLLPKKKQRSDAVRTEPILLEGNGLAFWRLSGYSSEPNILLQDIGSWDSVTPEEKWFAYDDEKRKAVEDYISSIRKKGLKMQVVHDRQ